jgi:hypothetical protein
MVVASTALRHRSEAESEIAELARGLAELAEAGREFRHAVPQVQRGFQELSALARSRGQTRVQHVARAFTSILAKLDQGPEGDIPFILDTAANYLETLRRKCASPSAGERP